ncbi:MAG: hypothetical protein ACLFS5_01910 [Spirochaetaceae bacterium]
MIDVYEVGDEVSGIRIDHYDHIDIRPAIDRIIVYRPGLRIELHVDKWPDEPIYTSIRRLRRIEKRKPVRIPVRVSTVVCAPLAALN